MSDEITQLKILADILQEQLRKQGSDIDYLKGQITTSDKFKDVEMINMLKSSLIKVGNQIIIRESEGIIIKDKDGTVVFEVKTGGDNDGDVEINGVPANFNFKPDYGDGSGSDHTVSGTENLTADTYYNDLTVPVGTILNTAGYRLYVAGTLTNAGTIRNNGVNAGTPPTGASGAVENNIGGGGAGGNGGVNGANGVAGTATNPGYGGAGGAGGDTSSYTKGAGGAVTNPSVGIRSAPFCYLLISFPTIALIKGGGGGGGGASNNFNGGGGGGGGGVILIAAKTIVNTGTISANGGNGANGDTGAAQTGGGGGGGGGLIIFVYSSLTNSGTISVAGGTKGLGQGGGQNGVDGSAGTIIYLQN